MDNNTTYPVIGVEDVRIKMFDGIVRTVSNIRYIPVLHKSLLSLEKFCKQDLKFIGERSIEGVQRVFGGDKGSTNR